MQPIHLYNTLTKEREEFIPLQKGKVSMYHCGPTVYDYAHIGNLRAYIFADTLRRTFEYFGYEVKQVINITDVGHLSDNADSGDDRMTKAIIREGKTLSLESMKEIADKYFSAFKIDFEKLNIEIPNHFPKASEHINEMIEIIKKLDEKGFVYKISDGLYFDTSKYTEYGKLGGLSEENIARVAENTEKKNHRDFCLWKFSDNLGWESDYGKGFPGWHIECSAMSKKYLGQPFDIHTGGIDHISIHHNNEIAQSECAEGNPLARIWMHNNFLTNKGDKMAKSSGGFTIVSDIEKKGISPFAYRYMLLNSHYRNPMDYSDEILESFNSAYKKIKNILADFPNGGKIVEEYKKSFEIYISDDLNMSKALALAWNILKDPNVSPADKKATVYDFDKVFGLNLSIPENSIPENIIEIANEREIARKNKDWKKSDELRIKIENQGFKIKDTDTGYQLNNR